MIDFSKSKFYQYILEEREEVLKLKWIESQKHGHDIGYDRAWLVWVRKHQVIWQEEKKSIFKKLD